MNVREAQGRFVYVNPCMFIHTYLAYIINIHRANGGDGAPKETFNWVMFLPFLGMIIFREPVQENDLIEPLTNRIKEEASCVYVNSVCKDSTSLCRNIVLTCRQYERQSYRKAINSHAREFQFHEPVQKKWISERFSFVGVNSSCHPCMLCECVINPRACAGKRS